MTKVIGVRFRTAGKIYFFAPGKFDIKQGDNVIVETARGVEFGRVVSGPKDVKDEEVVQPLKSVIRPANEQDRKTVEKNRQKEKEAFKICLEKIRKHKLEMKLIDVEYTFDGNKILFYFTADGRIDFRELVKDLAAVFRTRIELRQIGVRDETKIRGGIGICGRPLCCSTYLTEFSAVSIKMAKEQNLSLNPTKISGVCGRLMCCLTNEEETYEMLNSQLPSVGDMVTTKDGLSGVVHSLSVLRRRVKVVVNLENDEKEIREYQADDLKFKPRRKKQKVSKEEMRKLAALEKGEGASKLNDK
ncbi:PSP1 domain-containing protein [[Ruminococcus] torques]|uniref:PSP1 domain-containing protein n=1 Tax=[Ruminococcus] torques TaxID=33039 RepID=UPI001F9A03B5|nr:stage 0 sporulation family protein [[Ruminococcus] torques]MBS5400022.1 stage 0 sporulation family protein [Lachnospiraceae bacterium]MDM8235786.1 stage 0 sporulation family protein [[Ruminococcus] torques]HJC81205.1 stage 0 sporulation family protein [Candidatus Mediterraneibacter excrementipullorum]